LYGSVKLMTKSVGWSGVTMSPSAGVLLYTPMLVTSVYVRANGRLGLPKPSVKAPAAMLTSSVPSESMPLSVKLIVVLEFSRL
jgi:hypothetical protein